MNLFKFTNYLTIAAVCVATTAPLAQANVDLENGKTKYHTLCETCHGPTGRGDGVAASSLPTQPMDLKSELNGWFESPQSMAGDVLYGEVENGMPAWKGIISKQDAIDILSYIDSLK